LSLLGRLARLISACFGLPSLKPRALADGERLACALADHMSLVLSGSGEHVKCQPVRPGMSAMVRSIKIRY
jgi:hypothetical protein